MKNILNSKPVILLSIIMLIIMTPLLTLSECIERTIYVIKELSKKAYKVVYVKNTEDLWK